MSGNEFDFNIDSILEEFSLYSQGIGGKEKPAPASTFEETPLPPRHEAYSRESIPAEENSYIPPAEKLNAAPPRHAAPSPRTVRREDSEEDPFYRLKEDIKKRPIPEALKKRQSPSSHSAERRPAAEPRSERRSFTEPRSERRPATEPRSERHGHEAPMKKTLRDAEPQSRHSGNKEPSPKSRREQVKPPVEVEIEKPKRLNPLTTLMGIACAFILVIVLFWSVLNIHPGTSAAATESSLQKLDLVSRMDVYVNNMASDAMGDLAYIRKVYKIDENATFAPAPDQNKYGTLQLADAEKVRDVIQSARDSGLLEGQDMVFDPNANFYHISDIQYYYDDTILVICWKEQIDGKVCSFVEVKIADASQFRRKITEDTYGSSVKQYASQLSASANAVVAMNADFYAFRTLGMVVYQRQLFRYSDGNYGGGYFKNYNVLDHCFIDSKGDMLIMHRGEEYTKEGIEQYIADNDILFGLAFGPVLVENWEVIPCASYPAGEINTEYSRAGLGQMDSLHYLYMTVNWSDEGTPRATVSEFADIFQSKGVKTAYCLDGGQTSEIVMNDIPFNRIDFGSERTVSDIIYFATAIPESEVTK